MAFDLKTSLHDLVKMKVSIIALWLIKLLKLPTCDTAKNVIEISALKAKTA